jgi:hypothetical protein
MGTLVLKLLGFDNAGSYVANGIGNLTGRWKVENKA